LCLASNPALKLGDNRIKNGAEKEQRRKYNESRHETTTKITRQVNTQDVQDGTMSNLKMARYDRQNT